MAENIQNQFHCSGDCLNCRATKDRKIQWQYCAAQFSYNALRAIQTMQDAVKEMSGEVAELKARIEAIQDTEAMVYDPTSDSSEERPITQEGAGVEE